MVIVFHLVKQSAKPLGFLFKLNVSIIIVALILWLRLIVLGLIIILFLFLLVGRGVKCTTAFMKGDFLVEYRGLLLENDPGDGKFVFEFNSKGKTYW